MPCVLVSPDSVARFFPARRPVRPGRVRRGLADPGGRRGRCAGPGAKAAVVVGDSKQMPPTSFAEPTSGVRRRRRPAETAVEDEESILSECVQARVPRQWLSWHYRSQDESLIAFSATPQYYENRLSSFPAPTHGRPSSEPDGRGVSLVRVPGTFHRSGAGRLLRTNPIEAKAIVAEIRRRFDLVPKWGRAGRRPVDRRRHVQRAAAGLHRGAAPRRRRRPAGRGAGPRRRRGPVRQEPGERAGRRARRRLLLHRLLPERRRRAAAELRAAEPVGRRAAAERGDHPRPAPGGACSRRSTRSSCGPRRRRRSASSTCAPTSTWPRRAPTSCRGTRARRRWSTGTARRSPRRCASAGSWCGPTSASRTSGSTSPVATSSTRRRR